jgi:hypothetical protein
VAGDVAGIVKQRDAVAPKTEMVLNEWIPFLVRRPLRPFWRPF